MMILFLKLLLGIQECLFLPTKFIEKSISLTHGQ